MQVEAIKLHHLGPGGDKVGEEAVLAILAAGIDFDEGAQLRICAEDEVDRGGGPRPGSEISLNRLNLADQRAKGKSARRSAGEGGQSQVPGPRRSRPVVSAQGPWGAPPLTGR